MTATSSTNWKRSMKKFIAAIKKMGADIIKAIMSYLSREQKNAKPAKTANGTVGSALTETSANAFAVTAASIGDFQTVGAVEHANPVESVDQAGAVVTAEQIEEEVSQAINDEIRIPVSSSAGIPEVSGDGDHFAAMVTGDVAKEIADAPAEISVTVGGVVEGEMTITKTNSCEHATAEVSTVGLSINQALFCSIDTLVTPSFVSTTEVSASQVDYAAIFTDDISKKVAPVIDCALTPTEITKEAIPAANIEVAAAAMEITACEEGGVDIAAIFTDDISKKVAPVIDCALTPTEITKEAIPAANIEVAAAAMESTACEGGVIGADNSIMKETQQGSEVTLKLETKNPKLTILEGLKKNFLGRFDGEHVEEVFEKFQGDVKKATIFLNAEHFKIATKDGKVNIRIVKTPKKANKKNKNKKKNGSATTAIASSHSVTGPPSDSNLED